MYKRATIINQEGDWFLEWHVVTPFLLTIWIDKASADELIDLACVRDFRSSTLGHLMIIEESGPEAGRFVNSSPHAYCAASWCTMAVSIF